MSRAVVVIVAAVLAAGCIGPYNPVPDDGVSHPVIDASGKPIGSLVASYHPQGWTLRLKAKGLSPGFHGVHLHEVGRCQPPGFASAGAHLNPTGKQHGMDNPLGEHVGDLDNLLVPDNGAVEQGWTFTWKDRPWPNGLSLVIHANPDDNKTDPSGNSGERIACGVIFAG